MTMTDPLVLVGVYLLGVVTTPVVFLAWFLLVSPLPSEENIEDESRPYLEVEAEFVSRTTGETFRSVADAKAHARAEQGWNPDHPDDDTWRTGFTVRPDGEPEEVDA